MNNVENNPGPAVFDNTYPAGCGWPQVRELTKLVSSVRCVANYIPIYNQTENTVLRICLLDRAYKVPQDIKSSKNLHLLLTVTVRLTNIPGIVLVFVRMYIQFNVMQFNTLFISFTLDIKQCPIHVSQKLTYRSIFK